METLRAVYQQHPITSKIVIQTEFYSNKEVIDSVFENTKQLILFADHGVPSEMLDIVKGALNPHHSKTVVCTEENKSRDLKRELEDMLLQQRISKDCTIVCLGGGMLCDLIGFLASTYMRGVKLILIPTTLLCMVDACIGGKTAVNVGQVKNLIGTFYPASAVIIDPYFLTSLCKRQLQSGMAEVIKYGLTGDLELFQRLENGLESFRHKDMVFLEDLIKRSIRCKIEVVQQDLYDTGIRQTLNFGHTVGHAIETITDFDLTHGEAIAIGMCIEAHISFQKGLISQQQLLSVYNIFSMYEFPLSRCSEIDTDKIFTVMESDKKSTHTSVRIVCLSSIGKAYPHLLDITKEEVKKGIDHLNTFTIGSYALL